MMRSLQLVSSVTLLFKINKLQIEANTDQIWS